MIREITIAEAAEELRLPQATVRKKIKNGELESTKVPSSGGFRYKVLLDNEDITPRTQGPTPAWAREYEIISRANMETLEAKLTANTELIERFRLENKAQATELESRRREVAELHQLLAQQTALNAGRRPWWRFWG